jgi:hypothetical protein
MGERSYTTVDKASWGAGPWSDEPDKVQWTDDQTGLPCLVKRGPMGNWCGYVAVAEGHPWFEQDYDDVRPYPDVHGGLTYADFCQQGPEESSICHVPEPGQPDRVWWLGFDCGHAWDLMPAMRGVLGSPISGGVYRDIGFVRSEVEQLAQQCHAAGEGA